MAYPFLRRTILPVIRRFLLREIHGIEHIPREGSFILVANHSSYLEPIFLSLIIVLERNQRVRFIAKEHVYYLLWPIARWIGIIPRFRKQPSGVLQEAKRLLETGEIIGIFPEGGVNQDRVTLQKGKTGAARLALATKTAFLPVGYHGPLTPNIRDAFKRFFRPHERIRITFGKPFHLSEFYDKPFTYELLRDATKVIMEKIGEVAGKRLHPEDAGQLRITLDN